MQPLNIFVVHPSDSLTDHLPNGAGWIDYNYLRGLAERGHTLHIATPRVELRAAVPPRMHLHLIPGTGARRPGALTRLKYVLGVRRLFNRLSKTIRFDLAQQFTPVETGLSLALAGSGVPLILGPYSGHWAPDAFGPPKPRSFATRLKHWVRDRLASLQQAQADALVITCPAAIERICSPVARVRRVHVISHGIHGHEYLPRQALPPKPSILFLAVLEYWKGIFTLLDAFDRVAPRLPDATLEIWGDGRESATVDARIAASPYRDRIFRRGRAAREDVGSIMRAHSVYCMPSYGEPFGMTLLEAMASAVPVVTTDAGGPPYLVHREGGRVVPLRDAERLADALTEILGSRDLQASMGTYNRRRVEQEFDWSRSLDRMESVYSQVLKPKPQASSDALPDTRWTPV
ncbi:MAG TPA: glycosyltransferase family 4 protein [Steroidobacteraceae bacterium]|nr:glycosyltransferase family 4 protein [Steroidobacteraceae bacterium]